MTMMGSEDTMISNKGAINLFNNSTGVTEKE